MNDKIKTFEELQEALKGRTTLASRTDAMLEFLAAAAKRIEANMATKAQVRAICQKLDNQKRGE